ncbi:uridine kinase family protein [Actinomadura flavalba]|uniref:uridine kinase family protein n=1 Tax=Actinomadura flavalba TaxID=1120938 RepID=UPI0003625CA0|nr:hypothetical protein [Actinomadura flavalba]
MDDAVLTYPALAARVRALPPSLGPVRLVAVDGRAGSGKSTFAARLAAALGGAPVVGSDDFPVPWDAGVLSWRDPLAAVLAPLAEGRPALWRRYAWREGAYGPPEEIPAGPVLLVEGVGAAHPAAPAALRVLVAAPDDVRRARTLRRDGPEHAAAHAAWARREAAYFTGPGAPVPDLRVDGTGLTGEVLRVLP